MPRSLQTIANMFDQTRWAKDFSPHEVNTLAKYMSIHTAQQGTYIFKQGDKQNYMAFIIAGEVDIKKESVDDTERFIATLPAKTHFGEMAFVDTEPRSASAMAKTQVTLLLLSRDNFEAACEKHPNIGLKVFRNIAKNLSQRLRSTTGKLMCLADIP
ncbi:MAG: cyclic nucleotide-binding domain-containing protein [Desulfovibrionales bacterium]|nr:cyclic nucleotide-binding domain-containing protein [Desulfovibrionales bacterium]